MAGLFALAALVTLLVVVPAVLSVEIGSPFPHGRISIVLLEHSLTSPIPDAFWAKALAGAGWIVWAWLAVTTAAEIRAVIRRPMRGASARSSRRLAGKLVLRVAIGVALVYSMVTHASSDAVASESYGGGQMSTQVVHTGAPIPQKVMEPVGLGISSAGVVLMLDKLRRVQQRRRPLDTTIAMPPLMLARIEHRLREGTANPDDASLDAVANLIEIARAGEPRARISKTSASRVHAEAPEVEIAVLGPVEIRGAVQPFARAKSRELVVYLAMHPNGVDRDVAMEAMWPGKIVPRSTQDPTVSVARAALGWASDGTRHLPTGRGRLCLGWHVASDWDRFVELADPAVDTGQTRSADALGLIRGHLFQGLHHAGWTICDGFAPMMESRIVDVAITFGESCLVSGDPSQAAWAARQALKVSPYDERLYRILMRAADAVGNRRGVVAAMDELRAVVADDVEPFDTVHPETEDLYRALVGLADHDDGGRAGRPGPGPVTAGRVHP